MKTPSWQGHQLNLHLLDSLKAPTLWGCMTLPLCQTPSLRKGLPNRHDKDPGHSQICSPGTCSPPGFPPSLLRQLGHRFPSLRIREWGLERALTAQPPDPTEQCACCGGESVTEQTHREDFRPPTPPGILWGHSTPLHLRCAPLLSVPNTPRFY